MKTQNKLVIANMRQNKKRTRATLIAIILSCTFLFVLGIAFSSYHRYSIDKIAKEYGSYHVMYYDVDYQKSNEYFINNKDIKEFYVFQIIDQFEEKFQKVQVFSYQDELHKEINILRGKEPTNEKEILISESSMTSLNLSIGDKLGTYTIVGVYENYIKESYPESIYSFIPNQIVTVLTKSKIDAKSEHSCFFVIYKNVNETYDYIVRDKEMLNIPPVSTIHVQTNDLYLQAWGVGKTVGQATIYLILAIALYVVSVFCMLIIYNAFAISLTERKKQFGILRSLGASKKDIIWMITKEILILSLISFPISFILGAGIVAGGLKIFNILLDINIHLTLDFKTLGITVFFIAFTLVLSAYTPGRKASKTSPMEAIRSTKEYKIKNNKRQYKLTKKILGVEGQLARKNISRNGKQFQTVTTSLTISVVLFILVSMVVNLFTLELKESEESEMNSGILIRVSYKNRESMDKIIKELKNVSMIDSMIISRDIYVTPSKDNLSFTDDALANFDRDVRIVGLDEQNYRDLTKEYNLRDDKPILYNMSYYYKEGYENAEDYSDYVVHYEVFNENPQIFVCKREEASECDLELNGFNITEKKIKLGENELNDVTIIVQDKWVENFITQYPEYFESAHKDAKYYYINIQSEKFLEFDEEFRKIKERYPEEQFYYFNGKLDLYNEKRQILGIKIIMYTIIIFLGTISIVGMMNSINTNLSLREREFSMLRSIGYSKKSLNKMISLENIFLVSKSIIYALIFSYIGFFAINQSMSYDDNTFKYIFPPIIRMPYPWTYAIIAFVVLILLILVLTSFSIKKIKKQNIIEAIRKDSI